MIFLILVCMYFTLTEIPYNRIILKIHLPTDFRNENLLKIQVFGNPWKCQ